MRHRIDHHLDIQAARQLIDEVFAAELAAHPRHEPTLEWLSEHKARVSAELLGVELELFAELTRDSIQLSCEVPWSLRIFTGAALRVIDEEAQRWLREYEERQLTVFDG
jgi:hypothetical protein